MSIHREKLELWQMVEVPWLLAVNKFFFLLCFKFVKCIFCVHTMIGTSFWKCCCLEQDVLEVVLYALRKGNKHKEQDKNIEPLLIPDISLEVPGSKEFDLNLYLFLFFLYNWIEFHNIYFSF